MATEPAEVKPSPALPPHPSGAPPLTSPPPSPSLDLRDAPLATAEDEAQRASQVAEALEEDPQHRWPTDTDGIHRAVFESLGDLRDCYQGWLEVQPELQGDLTVRFVIGQDGNVSEASVVGGNFPEHAVFDACVLNVMSGMPFESPPGGELVVNYPFAFSPG